MKHGGINATVPRDLKPDELTLDQAVSLLAERAAKGGGKKPARAKKAAQGKSQWRGGCRAGQRHDNDKEKKPKTAKKKAAPKRKAPRPRPSRLPAPEPMAKGKVPTRDELLAFIRESATPVGKREIARA